MTKKIINNSFLANNYLHILLIDIYLHILLINMLSTILPTNMFVTNFAYVSIRY